MVVFIPTHNCGQATEILGVFLAKVDAKKALAAGRCENPHWLEMDCNIEEWEVGTSRYPLFLESASVG